MVAYGGEEALHSIRGRLPVTTRLLSYHHRVSFGVVAREATAGAGALASARAAAGATAVFDRRGCVSPHLFYVEEGGEVSAREWAALLADGLRAVEEELPVAAPSPAEASEIHQLRGAVEMAAAAGREVDLHRDEGVGWTVIYEGDPAFEASCPGRTVRVKPVADVMDIAQYVEPYRSVLQTVGYAGGVGAAAEGAASDGGTEVLGRLGPLAEALSRAGAFRFTSFDRLPWPPPWWHHDGTGPLRALVNWAEVETFLRGEDYC